MNLAEYIRQNAVHSERTVVYLRTDAWHSYTVSSPSEVPFDAAKIRGRPSSYLFVWDGVGVPLDHFGRRITAIQAFPAAEKSSRESSVFT